MRRVTWNDALMPGVAGRHHAALRCALTQVVFAGQMGACNIPGAGYSGCRNRVVREDPAGSGARVALFSWLCSGGHDGPCGCIVPSLKGTAPPSGSCRVKDAVLGLGAHSQLVRERGSPQSSFSFCTLPPVLGHLGYDAFCISWA